MCSSALSTLSLTDLNTLRSLSFGKHSCLSVTWFQLDLPHLNLFTVSEGAFQHCQQLTLQFLPALVEFKIGNSAFLETALVIYCFSSRQNSSLDPLLRLREFVAGKRSFSHTPLLVPSSKNPSFMIIRIPCLTSLLL